VFPVVVIPTVLGLLWVSSYYSATPNSASISFDNVATSYLFDGKLISTNKDNTLRVIPIDKLYDNIGITIFSSNLTEATGGNTIPSAKVTFNGFASLQLGNISTSTGSQEIKITVPVDNPGIYHGAISIMNKNTKSFFPILVNIKPNFNKIIIFVIDGIVFSVAVWNALGYAFLNRQTEHLKDDVTDFINRIYRSQTQSIVNKSTNTQLKQSLESIRTKLGQSDMMSARREFETLQRLHPAVNTEYNINTLLAYANMLPGPPNNTLNQNNYKNLINDFNNIKFSLKNYIKLPNVAEKNIISGFISIMFGLTVGFILFLQSDYITNLTTIGFTEGSILFLMGVGIGNLNEGIGKLWETEK